MDPQTATQVPSAPVQPGQPAPTPHAKTDVLGIVSIIMAVCGLAAVGLILGLIGASKAKKEHRSVVLSRIGWILSLVSCVVSLLILVMVFAAVPALQRNARDVQTKTDLLDNHVDIESYYAKNGYYPYSLPVVGSDAKTTGANGQPFEYTLTPLGCSVDCTDYTLSTTLESGEVFSLSSDD